MTIHPVHILQKMDKKISINLQQLDPINSAIPANPLHSEHLALQQNWWNSVTIRDCSMSTIKETIHAN